MGEGKPAFKKAALALNGGPTDELVVTLGCQLAMKSGAELVAIHVIEVDWSHELSDELTEENEAASAVLDQAEGIAEHFKVKISGDLLQAREVAAALVDEAIEIGADAIILGLPYRKRFGGDFAIGGTIPYVFQNAPCQVVVAREPMPSAPRVEMVPPAVKIATPVGTGSSAGPSGGLSGWSLRNRSRGNGRKNEEH
ncbi:MAG TPA: universal stress protein [Candidatus Limnocylindrales bacterium]|jgi:nucleotide-binding universal stress UspA family protein